MLVAQRRKGPSFIIRDFTDFFFLLDFDLAESTIYQQYFSPSQGFSLSSLVFFLSSFSESIKVGRLMSAVNQYLE